VIDLTRELPKPIRKQFLEKVLNKTDVSDINGIEDLQDLDVEELEAMLAEMGGADTSGYNVLDTSNMKESNVASTEGMNIATTEEPEEREESEARKREFYEKYGFEDGWWIKKDARLQPIIPKFETEDFFKNLVMAPYYLVWFTAESIKRRSSDNKPDLTVYFNKLFLVSAITSLVSLIGWLIYDLKFIASMSALFLVSIIMAGVSKFYIIKNTVEEPDPDELLGEIDKIEIDEDEEVPEEECEEEGEYYDDEEEECEDEEYVVDDKELSEEKRRKEYSEKLAIPQKIINADSSEKEFNKILLKAYKNSSSLRDEDSTDREDIIYSMREYVFCNNPDFSDLKSISKDSILYKNISYLTWEGMRKIKPQLTFTGDYKMNVKSVKESQIYYRIEFSITGPGINIKENDIMSNMITIMNIFKAHEADNDVSISASFYSDSIILKIMKVDNTIITWGDVIRYYDTEKDKGTFDEYLREKYDLPIMVGLQNEEVPFIFDVGNNTNIMIAGSSGSGKSWAVYNLIFNIIIQSHPGDVNFIILDRKKDVQYKTLARLPHVIGLHSDEQHYIDVIKEVKIELERRKNIMDRVGVSKWQDLRKSVKDDAEALHKLPWLFVVIEEMAATLAGLELASKKKEPREEFISSLVEIAKQGRSCGIRLVVIAQRTTDNELPRAIVSECSVRWTFRLDIRDLEKVEMYNSTISPPNKIGMSLFASEETGKQPVSIKALGIGGKDDRQILNLTRMLAFEWQSRLTDEEALRTMVSFKYTDNRAPRREEVLNDLMNKEYFEKDIDGDRVISAIGEIDGDTVPQKNNNKVVSNGSNQVFKQNTNSNEKDILVSIRKGNVVKNNENVEPEQGLEIRGTGERVNVIDGRYERRRAIVEDIKKSQETGSSKVSPMMGFGGSKPVKKIEDKKEPVKEKVIVPELSIEDEINKVFVETPKGTKKKPISQFVLEIGEGPHSNKVKKDELKKYYTAPEIKDALANLEILEEDDYYMA